MSRVYRLAIFFTAALLPIACSIIPPEQATGTRPEIIFADVDGIWQPARGIERSTRPAIPDGQLYHASGPFEINMRDIPLAGTTTPSLQGLQRRGGGRMESPLPAEVMDKLRDDARFLRANPFIQDISATAVAAPSLAAATSVSGFDSIDYNDCCSSGGNVPPDPELAAGPNHLIAVVNVAFEIYTTSGASLKGPTTFADFFSGVPGCSGVFDPNVNYDEAEDRFILGIDGDGQDYCIAVSQNGDPTGDWFLYSFQTASKRDFFDYPHAGVGDDAIYLGANIFGRRFFKEGRIWAIDKIAMYTGNAPTIVSFGTGSESTPQPMNLHGSIQGTWPTDGAHYILTDGQSFDGKSYGVWSWSNPFAPNNPVKLGEVDLNTASGGIVAGMPIDAPQQDGGKLQANDWRGQDAEYRNGYIWMSNAQACNPGGGTVNCVRWAQIDPSDPNGPSVVNAGVFSGNGEYRSFPDLAVDSCGNMLMGYSKTSSSSNPGIYAVGRDNGGGFQAEIEVKSAEVVYQAFDGAPYRWGDYTEMTIAPDGSTFWYLGEYSKDTGNANGRWGTWINSFTFGCDGGGNLPPVAAIVTPADCTLLNCNFDGSNSTDSDGTIDNYSWDFGDGSATGSGTNPSHTYTVEGTYNVSLTVTDNDGASNSVNLSVTVDDGINIPPNAVITLIDCTDLTCTFNGTGSSDSDGNISDYAWGFGDTNTGSGATTSHEYGAYGSYTVTLTVTDDEGATNTNDASETFTLTESADPKTLSVVAIIVDTLNRGSGYKSPRATATIEDDQGNPVGAVNVSGVFTDDAAGSDSDTTDGNGSVTLISSAEKKGRVKFTFCITDVSDNSGNLAWDRGKPCASN